MKFCVIPWIVSMCFMLSQTVKWFELLLHLIFPNDEPNENCANIALGLINCDIKLDSSTCTWMDKNICHCGVASLSFIICCLRKNSKRNLELNCIYQLIAISDAISIVLENVCLSFPLISCSLCDCFSLLMRSHHFVFYHFRRRYDLYAYEHKVPCATTQCTFSALAMHCTHRHALHSLHCFYFNEVNYF